MKKSDIKELMGSAIKNVKIVNVYFRFSCYYYNRIPLAQNDKLFITVNEDDFILNGYSIYRFKDVTKVTIKNDKCDEILKSEGITSSIVFPKVDISNWNTVFESLKHMNKNVTIEKETVEGKNDDIYIGRIEKIYKKFAYIWEFDADGRWYDKPTRILYSEITKITFDNRYVEVFSKYIENPPFNE